MDNDNEIPPSPVPFVPTPITPNPPDTQLPNTNAGSQPKKKIIIIAISLIIVVIGILLIINYLHPLFPNKPHSISKSVPVTLNLARGKLDSINQASGTLAVISGTNITVNANGKDKTFSIAGTRDFERVVSGTLARGDVRTQPAASSDLHVGQNVLVIADINSVEAKVVYILP